MKTYISRICLAAIVIPLAGCAFVNVSLVPGQAPLAENVIGGSGKAKILVMDVSGILTTREGRAGLGTKKPSVVSRVREELDRAANDRDVKGMIVKIDSPGGSVTASDMIYHEIREFASKRSVPVYSVVMNLGTSGGYYASLAADRIYAHPTSITGSIGVIAMRLNIEGLMRKIGVEDKSVKSGEMKDMFSPFRPDSEEEREIIEGIISELHRKFIEVVAERRAKSLSKSGVEALADGRPYTAAQALESGLIDGIGYLDDAVGDMKAELGIDEARLVSYSRPGAYRGSIYSTAPFTNSGMINFITLDTGIMAGAGGVEFMYLWRP